MKKIFKKKTFLIFLFFLIFFNKIFGELDNNNFNIALAEQEFINLFNGFINLVEKVEKYKLDKQIIEYFSDKIKLNQQQQEEKIKNLTDNNLTYEQVLDIFEDLCEYKEKFLKQLEFLENKNLQKTDFYKKNSQFYDLSKEIAKRVEWVLINNYNWQYHTNISCIFKPIIISSLSVMALTVFSKVLVKFNKISDQTDKLIFKYIIFGGFLSSAVCIGYNYKDNFVRKFKKF